MTKAVSKSRLVLLHDETSRVVRKHKDTPRVLYSIKFEINIRELNSLLEELLRRRKLLGGGFKVQSEISKWMINSKIGDILIVPELDQGRLNTYRNTARRALGNPEAFWATQRFGEGKTEIERVADGLDPNTYRRRNPAIAQMIALNVNGRVVVENHYKGGRLPGKNKVIARRLMGNPDADWRYTNLANGKTKVVRTK